MSQWLEGDIDVNGVRIHYTRTGGDKPQFVLAHGFSDDGLCWTPVAEELQVDYDVVMVDARGHGRSAAPDDGYDPRTQAQDLLGVIEGLGLSKPFVLGHSMGAVTTLMLAAMQPDIPRAILLEDPPAWWIPPPEDNEEINTRNAADFTSWITELQSKSREELISEESARNPRWSQAELGPWADAKLRFNVGALAAVAGRNPAKTVDWEAFLRRITCPVLVITADQTLGAILPPTAVGMLRTWIPQMRVSHIAEAGHSIRRDQFNAYLDTIRNFTDEVADATQPSGTYLN